jgi:small GTP-binding protein
VIFKKVCLLGAAAVGKTSLVQRFVNGIFDDRYLSTIGAKIDARTVSTPSGEAQLMIWDLNGEEMFNRVQSSYLRGMHGFLLVFDPTRPETLEFAQSLLETVRERVGDVPGLLVCNKADLRADWLVGVAQVRALEGASLGVIETSAKSGEGVEAAFTTLGARMLGAGEG